MAQGFREVRPDDYPARGREIDASLPTGAEPGSETYDGSLRDAAGLVKTGFRRYASIKTRIGLGMLALLVLTGVPFMFLQWIGPRAEPPAEPPIDRLNREHADLWPNAADVYGEFGEFLREIPKGELDEFVTPTREPLPEHVSAWIEDREYLAHIVRPATAWDNYFCRIEMSEAGLAMYRQANVVRAICKYMALRARWHAERRDLAGFLDSLRIADRVGRHVRQQPTRIGQVAAIGCRALPQEWVLIPFSWPDVATAPLLEYSRQAVQLCDEAPTPLTVWQTDLDIDAWIASRQFADWLQWFVPPSRVRGEMLERIAPFHELVAAPVEDWVNPADLRRNVLLAKRPASTLASAANVPGWVASFFSDQMGPGNVRILDLDARLIALQRGNRAALAAWEYRLRHGRWPQPLSEAQSGLPNEPYTRQPYIYRVSGDEMTLYAAGIDRDDDGGWHDRRFGERKAPTSEPAPPPDGDYVFWPIPEPCDDE